MRPSIVATISISTKIHSSDSSQVKTVTAIFGRFTFLRKKKTVFDAFWFRFTFKMLVLRYLFEQISWLLALRGDAHFCFENIDWFGVVLRFKLWNFEGVNSDKDFVIKCAIQTHFYRVLDRVVKRFMERVMEKVIDRFMDRFMERVIDRFKEKVMERVV